MIPPAAPAAQEEIVVIGTPEGQSIDGKRLRAAQRAFAADHARFAPNGILYLTLRPHRADALSGAKVTLRRGDEVVPLALDAEGRALLPPLDADGWRLVVNRKPAELGLRLRVFSPGTSEADRRLGDLRLQCRVIWAMEKGRFSLPQRAGFDLVGGCGSKRIVFWTSAPRPVAAGTITADGKTRPLPIKADGRYRMPVADRSLSDEARLSLTFR